MDLQGIYLIPLALAKTTVAYLLQMLGYPSRVRQLDDFAPHPGAGFEGYYSRTQLDDGGTLAIIFCWVEHAERHGNLVCVSYTPIGDGQMPSFHHEFYPDHLDATVEEHARDRLLPFILNAFGIGVMNVSLKDVQYAISVPDAQLSLTLRLTNRTAWSDSRPLEGPMGPLAHLARFLPLNWHVYSTSSDAEYVLHAGRMRRGRGKAHIEKNWGICFPSGWIWSQSFEQTGGSFSLAGGAALPGVQAYLIGYRSPKYSWNFRPPFTAAIGRFSPFMDVHHDSRTGSVRFEIQTFFRRMSIEIDASPDSFIGFPAPLKDGHQPRFAFESFRAATRISLYVRRWPFGKWTHVETGSPARLKVAFLALLSSLVAPFAIWRDRNDIRRRNADLHPMLLQPDPQLNVDCL